MDVTHACYIDDSGSRGYLNDPTSYSATNSRHFVFGALVGTIQEVALLSQRIIATKIQFFGTDDVEMKSNWLRIPKERVRRYCDPYSISEQDLTRFTDTLYDHICDGTVSLVASVVDKARMQVKYKFPHAATATAYEMLLQRIQFHSNSSDLVSVSMDDTTGANPAGNQYKDNLTRQHRSLKAHGSRLYRGTRFPCIAERLRFIDSAHSHLIQVADLVAYNVYRQCRDSNNDWLLRPGEISIYSPLERMLSSFWKNDHGTVAGFGIAYHPKQ